MPAIAKNWEGGRVVRAFRSFIAILATLFILYHLFYTSDLLVLWLRVSISPANHVAVHLGLVLFFTYLLVPVRKGASQGFPPWYDIILALLSLVPTIYYGVFYATKIFYTAGQMLTEHILLGWLLVILLIEATRRLVGWIFALLVVIFVIYALFGNYFPGFLESKGYSLDRLGIFLYLAPEGIFGIPINISAVIIVVFLIFSQLLVVTGAGDFFINTAFSLLGQVRGGPAKVAVVASGAFGTLSGVTAANIAATGTFTIPLMKKIGYRPEVAGGIESVASLGGAFMPPVMGSVVFIICEFIRVPYIEVAVRSFIPAILYYLALFIMVDLEAAKGGLRGLSRAELPPLLKTLRSGFWYLVPLFLLVHLMIGPMYTAQKAALWALVALVALTMFRKETRLNLKKLIDASEETVRMLLMVAVACGAAGIIIGTVSITGLGNILAMELVNMAGGHVLPLLVLAAATSFVMGMGFDPVSCYIFLAMLVAPALVSLGVSLLSAHLFIFWFGMVSLITPPVCMAAYVAAGIAGTDPMKTGWQATRLGIATYLVPFSFALSPALLLMGTPAEIALGVVTATIGVTALAIFAVGYFLTKIPWRQRILFLPAAIMLIMPGLTLAIIGFSLLVVAVLWHITSWRAERLRLPVAKEGKTL